MISGNPVLCAAQAPYSFWRLKGLQDLGEQLRWATASDERLHALRQGSQHLWPAGMVILRHKIPVWFTISLTMSHKYERLAWLRGGWAGDLKRLPALTAWPWICAAWATALDERLHALRRWPTGAMTFGCMHGLVEG